MCGRYTYYSSEEIIKEFDLKPKQDPQTKLLLDVRENYNVAPGHIMPVVIRGKQEHYPELMKWGLIPSWSKDDKIGYKLINAREETLYQKSVWKRLVKSHRCIVPATGFYEWQKTNEGKIPYYITPKEGEFFSFAGLWDEWKDEEGNIIKSYTIITTSPNKEMSALHDRMPVILNKQLADIWLSPLELSEDQADELLKPAKNNSLKIVRVSTQVNSVKNNYEELIYELKD